MVERNETTWFLSDRADPRAVRIADGHYSRQKPGTPQFVPPGRCLVLLTEDADALWVTSWPFAEYVKHDWPGAWINSLFHREPTAPLASELIRAAVAVTRWPWDAPPLGMLSFVEECKVRHKRDPGRCYVRAGFRFVGYTKGGLHAFQMLPKEMPDPASPAISQEVLAFSSGDEL